MNGYKDMELLSSIAKTVEDDELLGVSFSSARRPIISGTIEDIEKMRVAAEAVGVVLEDYADIKVFTKSDEVEKSEPIAVDLDRMREMTDEFSRAASAFNEEALKAIEDSSAIIDRISSDENRPVLEIPRALQDFGERFGNSLGVTLKNIDFDLLHSMYCGEKKTAPDMVDVDSYRVSSDDQSAVVERVNGENDFSSMFESAAEDTSVSGKGGMRR